jgi:hypothetical protein
MATLLQLAQRQRNELNKTDAANLEAVARAYAVMFDDLQGDVDALILAIEKLDNPTRKQVEALPQYKRLMRRAEAELDDFSTYLKTTVGAVGAAGIVMGLLHSALQVKSADKAFVGLGSNAVKPLLDYLRADGPLYARLKLITDATIDKVGKAIVDGVSSGFNPRKTASLIQDAFGGGLTDALRNVRTVQIYSYRDAARANYMASDGIVSGWIWFAELDADTCMACVAEHGTVHPLDEKLDGHYNCRCSPIPFIEGLTEDIQKGQDWFDGLSDEQQKGAMGPGKYDAYKAGLFEFSALSNQQDNDIFGTMRTETALHDLVPDGSE